ncbi:hypothetical protein KFU94_17775 [Chloroflexi bacterium TSY]|nr:hypothetical protein [Chloroflexi bacterium TSY]
MGNSGIFSQISILNLDDIVSVVRSYLFRLAVWNTFRVIGFTLLLVIPFGYLGSRQIGRNQSIHVTWIFGVFLPLMIPIAVVAVVWRPLFQAMGLLYSAEGGLFAIACVYAWRLLPLTILLLHMQRTVQGISQESKHGLWCRLRQQRGWLPLLTIALVTSYVILTAVSPPLLLTGGEPFNATHLWSGWAFQQVHVSRQYKVGATILLLQVPFLVLVSAPLPYLLLRYFRFDPVSSVAQQSVAVQPMRRNVFAALTLIFYLVLPFILWSLTIKNGETQMISPVANPIEVSRMLVHVGYYDWFIQSITLAVMGAIVTLVLGLIGQSLVSQVRFNFHRQTTRVFRYMVCFDLYAAPLVSHALA